MIEFDLFGTTFIIGSIFNIEDPFMSVKAFFEALGNLIVSIFG